MWKAFRVGEVAIELGRDHQRDERTLVQRAAHRVDPVGPKATREVRRKGPDRRGPHAERLEIQPEVAVVSRLEREMPAPRAHGREEGLRAERRIEVGHHELVAHATPTTARD